MINKYTHLRTGKKQALPGKPFYRTLGPHAEISDYTVEQGEFAPLLFVCFFIVTIFSSALCLYRFGGMQFHYNDQMKELQQVKESLDDTTQEEIVYESDYSEEAAEIASTAEGEYGLRKRNHVQTMDSPEMLSSMRELYEMNPDVIGWLKIEDTNIDYNLMQCKEDEKFYLDRDFMKNYSANGSLILDNDSDIGSGTRVNAYDDGTLPSTNLIIHGHNMKSGAMFGNLDKYRQQEYEQKHNIIRLTTLYEEREYEIMAVCLSQVYLKSQTDVFKYYKFFEAYNKEEFDYFYDNIKKLQLYDTGVTAEYGDEFITLSVCAYHVENGRLVVVGKRIK
ncbi:MAG: class B sortase [Lachnospiraceae bacterium]|nr:class B sortase [Lachnospiraceae bacterium]